MARTEHFRPHAVSRRTLLGGAAVGTAAISIPLTGLTGMAFAEITIGDPLGIATETIDVSSLPRVKQLLVAPPLVPEHEQVATGEPKIVEVEMTVKEKRITIDDEGGTIWVFAYDGHVPGPMIVVHQGDYVELTLKSDPANQLEHNIDFHAATGAMGGGALTLIQPGEKVVIRFRLIKAGVFAYHCAPGGEMTPYHVCHGMNGAIMVLPRDGLHDKAGNSLAYDKVFYLGEQDYYVARDPDGNLMSYDGAMEDYGDALETMRKLIPSHVVFNGAKGSLTEDNALTAKVGDNVLFVHLQANRDTRPHLIGGHGDYVWETGSFNDTPATDLETWFIRGGSAGAMLYKFRQPGMYAYVNHNLIEAVMLGAVAHVNVEGDWNNQLMEQIAPPALF